MSKFITLIADQNVCAPQGFKAAGFPLESKIPQTRLIIDL